jgi:5-methylcytosine-specific restriction endonuclease McrA
LGKIGGYTMMFMEFIQTNGLAGQKIVKSSATSTKTLSYYMRTKKTYQQKSFSQEVKQSVYDEFPCCWVCGASNAWEFHHVFYRSELYRDIINWKENCALLCSKCHNAITNKTKENNGQEYDKLLKQKAIEAFAANERCTNEDIAVLKKIYRERHGLYVWI